MIGKRIISAVVTVVAVCLCLHIASAANLPPPPSQPFADYVGIVSKTAAQELNRILTEFERTSSCQVVVAIYDRLPQGEALEDYANRVFNSWGVGQKTKNNGVLMLIFFKDRKIRIEVGYGLEGVLPDALAKRIIDEQIAPRFRTGDYYGGLKAGVQGIIAAIHGEYKSNSVQRPGIVILSPILFFLLFGLIMILSFIRHARYVITGKPNRYTRVGRSGPFIGGIWTGGGGWSGGGGHSGGGGASGGW